MEKNSGQKITLGMRGQSVHYWLGKIFGPQANRSRILQTRTDRRRDYRLDLAHHQPIDASLISRNGAVVGTLLHNMSGGGLCCQIFEPLRLSQGQLLTAVFVLPLEEPFILKTEARLVTPPTRHTSYSRIIRLGFSNWINETSQDTLHRFILENQLAQIRQNTD